MAKAPTRFSIAMWIAGQVNDTASQQKMIEDRSRTLSSDMHEYEFDNWITRLKYKNLDKVNELLLTLKTYELLDFSVEEWNQR